jgi:hypothetical protein
MFDSGESADGVTMPAEIYAWVPATCASTTRRSRAAAASTGKEL